MSSSTHDIPVCPVCKSPIESGIEYPRSHPAHYDGVSVWVCAHNHRWGRWTGNVLEQGDVEWPYGKRRKK